jgi:putative molybdopterin biosynthesis protein
MDNLTRKPPGDYLTARDVSRLLDINEKKVYVLAQEGKLPATKVTGKWLFPRQDLDSFLRSKAAQPLKVFSTELALSRHILLLAGSDDPAISMIQGVLHRMHPDFLLFSASVGSREGLELLARHHCHIALSHLFDDRVKDYNFPFFHGIFERPGELAVINLFHRTVGFLSKSGKVRSFADLLSSKASFVNRQQGSGIRHRIDRMMKGEGIDPKDVPGWNHEVYTHLDVARHVLGGSADAGVAIESVARYSGLHFSQLFEERFDMVLFKDQFFERNVQIFVEFVRSEQFRDLLSVMSGYSTATTGTVLYPSSQDSTTLQREGE